MKMRLIATQQQNVLLSASIDRLIDTHGFLANSGKLKAKRMMRSAGINLS